MPKIDVLQEMLNAGLLQSIPGDAEFQSLRKAVTDLSSRFRKIPREVITAALVALDSEAPHEEAVIGLAENHILRHWKTFRGKYRNLPVAILRPVILSAIMKASDNPDVAIAAWYTSVSIIPHLDFGREGQTISRIMFELAEEVVQLTELNLRDPKKKFADIEFKSLDPPSIPPPDSNQYSKLVTWATGPQGEDGQAPFKDPNPQWPNNNPQWAYDFAKRFAQVLAKTQKNAADQAIKAVYDDFSERISDPINRLTRFLLDRETSNGAQLSVLSWAYALYSKSLHRSYRNIPLVPASVAMAYDLSSEAGAPCSPSVVYILGESISRLSSGEAMTIRNLLKQVQKNGDTIKQIIPPPKEVKGRIQLISAVNLAAHGHDLTRTCTKSCLGVDPESEISLSEFGMWCFRDLQALSVTGTRK